MSWDLFEGNWNHTKEKVRGKWSMPFVTAAISLNQLLSSATALPPIYVRKEVDDWFRWQNWRSPYFTTSILNHRSVKMPVLGPYRLKA